MIFTEWPFSKKHRKNLDFGVVFGGPNHENSKKNGVGNHVFFGHRFFGVFLQFFAILARFWEAPEAQKINKNLKKSRSGRFWNVFGIQYRFWTRFWSDLGGFWKDFGRILGGFWEDFWKDLILQTMIRATKGISMDGWMDG